MRAQPYFAKCARIAFCQPPKIVPSRPLPGRVLAEDIPADRDYPPFNRSVRDGFAVRSADIPGRVRIIGEVRAGERFPGSVEPGQAVEIMTGAPVPEGADAVVMVEHCVRHDDGPSKPIAPRQPERTLRRRLAKPARGCSFCNEALASTTLPWRGWRPPDTAALPFMHGRALPFLRPAMKSWRSPKPPPRTRSATRMRIRSPPRSGAPAAIQSFFPSRATAKEATRATHSAGTRSRSAPALRRRLRRQIRLRGTGSRRMRRGILSSTAC